MAEPYSIVPLSALRKVIATRMTEAKRNIPHFRVMCEIRADGLLAARDAFNGTHPQSRVSINDCFVKASATALMQHPRINVQLEGQELRQYHDADISVVVAVDGGLSTPIVRAANRKSVSVIASETKDLMARAAANQLRMHEIVGGSFSISNLGAYGVEQFDAIINPPQCAILAFGSAKSRAIVDGDGQLRAAKTVYATMSIDHRAIDGAQAAAFLGTLREVLERPQPLFSAPEAATAGAQSRRGEAC